MKNILITLGVLALLLVGGFFALNTYIYKEKQAPAASDYKNAEYIIETNRVRLKNGVAETEAAPGSSSKVVTRYFGNEIKLDLNEDGREDVVFLLTQQPGGSGTFFYAVAALNTDRGYVGSAGYLLGDRIAPQTTEISQNPNHQRVIVVNYADRAAGEPMTAAPSVGKSVWLKFDPQNMQFGEVVQNFEGEADPGRMGLTMKPWTWNFALYNDGRKIMPRQKDAFKLTFSSDGRFTLSTDCNSVAGSYQAGKTEISFRDIISTKKYCEGSEEGEVITMLENSTSYHFSSKGELILDLKFDSGSVIFR